MHVCALSPDQLDFETVLILDTKTIASLLKINYSLIVSHEHSKSNIGVTIWY